MRWLERPTHITTICSTAANIDWEISKAAPPEDASALGQGDASATPEKPRMTDFKPYMGRKRKPSTGCISQISEHCWEGRDSPMRPDGKKHSRNVYAKTREECEALLPRLIAEMKAEIMEAKRLKELRKGNGQPMEGKKGEKRNTK